MFPVVMPTYNRVDLDLDRGEGSWLIDRQGTRYLDFAAGIAVNALGHCHPHLVAALTEQAGKMWHCSNIFTPPGQVRLAQRLVDATFADTVFFTNSGVEAWECGVKLVRKHFSNKGQPQRWRIITVPQAFHGRTLTAISAAKQEKMTAGFGPLVDGFDQAPWGDLDAMRAAIGPETAAIHLEPIQGEGGIRVASDDYLRGLRGLCDEFGLLLYLDEIQSGMGRSGRLFAHEWADVRPDVMSVAKGIGGGFPLGACLATADAAAGMGPGTHGTTYGGNPLAMAVGNAVMDLVATEDFLGTVRARSQQLLGGLGELVENHPSIFAEARGMGLLVGLRCQPEVGNLELIRRLRTDHKLIAVGAGDNVVRLLPPLNVSAEEVDMALQRLAAAAEAEEARAAAA